MAETDFIPFYASSPLAYGTTVGTSAISAVPLNTLRTAILFHNPNTVALLAFSPGTASIGGGSLVILPQDYKIITGVHVTSAFTVISDTPGSGWTVWEFL